MKEMITLESIGKIKHSAKSTRNAEIIIIDKLKKDGSIDSVNTARVANALKEGKLVLMPVDSIYGIVSLMSVRSIRKVARMTGVAHRTVVHMISSFKMLDKIARINKMEFDFLRRIWPAELIVYMKGNNDEGQIIPLRMPRNKYQHDILNTIGQSLIYSAVNNSDGKPIFNRDNLVSTYRNKVDLILIVKEFCKKHTLPSMVDISGGNLSIVNEGRVHSDEIRSIYFL